MSLAISRSCYCKQLKGVWQSYIHVIASEARQSQVPVIASEAWQSHKKKVDIHYDFFSLYEISTLRPQ
jgi:hypothetical protein